MRELQQGSVAKLHDERGLGSVGGGHPLADEILQLALCEILQVKMASLTHGRQMEPAFTYSESACAELQAGVSTRS